MDTLTKVLKGGKTYYNRARSFNRCNSTWFDSFDLIHYSIIESIETGKQYEKCANIIRHRADYDIAKYGNMVYRPRMRQKVAGWNKTACAFLREVNELLTIRGIREGMHAMNGGEAQFGRYSVDFFLPKYKIVVEYNESHHYIDKQRINRDNNRRLYLEKITNLPLIVVHDGIETPNACVKMIIRNIKLYKEKQWYS